MYFETVYKCLAKPDGRLFGHKLRETLVEVGEAIEIFDEEDRVYALGKITLES